MIIFHRNDHSRENHFARPANVHSTGGTRMQGMAGSRIFLLSPAHSGGERARMLRNPGAEFELARRLRRRRASLGEVFAFLSGLYFRGKLAYATQFASMPDGTPGVWVITSCRGLLPADTLVGPRDLEAFSEVPIHETEERYAKPLLRTAQRLRARLVDPEVVLLGSIATGKYVDVLLSVFGERLLFPVDFIGRGDMSRGGLMLRQARSRVELSYLPVLGAMRRGRRPPKLLPEK